MNNGYGNRKNDSDSGFADNGGYFDSGFADNGGYFDSGFADNGGYSSGFADNGGYSDSGFADNNGYSGNGFADNNGYSGSGFADNNDYSGSGFADNDGYSGSGFADNNGYSGSSFADNNGYSGSGFADNNGYSDDGYSDGDGYNDDQYDENDEYYDDEYQDGGGYSGRGFASTDAPSGSSDTIGYGGTQNGSQSFGGSNNFGGTQSGSQSFGGSNDFGGTQSGSQSFGGSNNFGGTQSGSQSFGGSNDFGGANNFGSPQDEYDPNAPLYRPERDGFSAGPSTHGSSAPSGFSSSGAVTGVKKTNQVIVIIGLVLVLAVVGGFFAYKAFFEKKTIKEYWESSAGQSERARLKTQILSQNAEAVDCDIITEGDDTMVFVLKYDVVSIPEKNKVTFNVYMESLRPTMQNEIREIMDKGKIREFKIVYRFTGKNDNVLAEYTFALDQR